MIFSGDNTDSPCVIKVAPTGTAASNIEGQTLHTAFSFSFDGKTYSLTDKARDLRRRILVNLRMIIIDEISMVKSDMLYQLDLRLQEITQKYVPFGGISIFVFGDLMQLKPVMGNYIFEDPRHEDYIQSHLANPRWKMFQCLVLEKNHRQGKDKIYADLLNRVRVGEQTEDDLKVLSERLRPSNHVDIINADLFIGGKRRQCAEINKNYIFHQLKESSLKKLKAINFHQTRKNFQPKINDKDGTIGSTSFQNKLFLKKGAKIMIIHNIDTIDSLTNGQMGTIKDFIESKEGNIEKLIVKLSNENAGRLNRQKYPFLAEKYPGCIIIERMSLQYSLRAKSGDAGSTATLIQFPITLAHAVTGHKVQGQSIPVPNKVVMDINSTFQCAQSYVMLSRIQTIDQLFILKNFDERKLQHSEKSLQELKRLEEISYNANPTDWENKNKNGTLKIAMLNCAGLRAHVLDIRADNYILQADIIHLVETSVEKDSPTNDLELEGYTSHFHNITRGKGIVTYVRRGHIENPKSLESIYETGIQICAFNMKNVSSLAVYRSSLGNVGNLKEKLVKLMNKKKCVLILGDFNICTKKKPNNPVTTALLSQDFISLIDEATQIEGGYIDQAYWRDEDNNFFPPKVERYSPYYSDHDAICVTLTKTQSLRNQSIKVCWKKLFLKIQNICQ